MADPVPSPADAEAARVEAAVARELAPSAEFLERLAGARERLVAKVERAARERHSPLVRALVAGSAARGTFLSDRLDVDLFLLFPPDLSDDRLKEEGLALGRAVLAEPTLKYADHPYLRGKFEGFAVDAVPGFAVDDPGRPRSPVDRTPFHQAYLSERETPALVAEVRLAKQFLRTLGVYGSEARTEGFSGYLLELLVLEHGSFRGLLRAARSWRIPVRLTPAGREPPRLPTEVALVLADPVDANRNVATALSRRNLATLIVAAGAYLARPGPGWFRPRAPAPFPLASALRELRRRETHAVVFSRPKPELVDDTLYPQVRKAERAIVDELERAGFRVLGSASAADADRVVVVAELAERTRPLVRRRDGPPAGVDRTGDFLATWPADRPEVLQGPYVRADGSLGVETSEKDRDVEAFLRERIPRLSLGRHLSGAEGVRVEPLEAATESPALLEALRALLRKGLPWPPRADAGSTSG